MRVVLANGCFDILHVGHLWHLEAARELGDYLIVAVTLDEYVNKGPHRPVNPFSQRARLVAGLKCVDAVYPSSSAPQAILDIRPNVFVKGIDYEGNPMLDQDRVACEEVGAELRLTRTRKMGSGDIIEKIRRTFG